jgi:protocatechuate 3,4-dioxygenase alpha subunit
MSSPPPDETPLGPTPSQTIGPFFGVGLPRPGEELAVPMGTPGAFWLSGRVTDGAGDPVPDALVETWEPSRRLLGRSATDPDGRYAIHTTGPETGAGPPGLLVNVFARGLLRHLVTIACLPDRPSSAAVEALLATVVDPVTRATLMAVPVEDGFRFDIRLQGDGETAFFER